METEESSLGVKAVAVGICFMAILTVLVFAIIDTTLTWPWKIVLIIFCISFLIRFIRMGARIMKGKDYCSGCGRPFLSK